MLLTTTRDPPGCPRGPPSVVGSSHCPLKSRYQLCKDFNDRHVQDEMPQGQQHGGMKWRAGVRGRSFRRKSMNRVVMTAWSHAPGAVSHGIAGDALPSPD